MSEDRARLPVEDGAAVMPALPGRWRVQRMGADRTSDDIYSCGVTLHDPNGERGARWVQSYGEGPTPIAAYMAALLDGFTRIEAGATR